MRVARFFFSFFFYTVVLLLRNLNQHIPAWKHIQFRLLIKAPHSPGERRREKKNQPVFIYSEGEEEEGRRKLQAYSQFNGGFTADMLGKFKEN